MGESEENEVVVDSTPSWRRKGRVIVAASLVTLAPLVVGVMALAVGDEPAAVMAATATSLTAITDPPETTTTSSTTTTSTTSTTTSTTTTTTAPAQTAPPPPTAPLPPFSVSITLEGPYEESCDSGGPCYYFVPTIVGVTDSYSFQCKGTREISGIYTLPVTQDVSHYCYTRGRYEADVWVTIVWNGRVANSNVIHVP